MGVLGEVNSTWSLKRLLVILLIRFRFHCILEIILNLWSLDFCKRLVRVFLFWSFIFILDLIVFSKLYKFSKFVMYLNSRSMDLGRDSRCLLVCLTVPFKTQYKKKKASSVILTAFWTFSVTPAIQLYIETEVCYVVPIFL